mgnify:CR=1 FL=1
MTPGLPYVIRAVLEWITDDGFTPYVVAKTKEEGILIPKQLAGEEFVTLNVGDEAVRNLSLDEEGLAFSARFSGVAHQIVIPLSGIHMVYARENGAGVLLKSPGTISFIPSENSRQDTPLMKKKPVKPKLTLVE